MLRIERFRTPKDFWAKITTYQNYWNLARPNSYKGDRTPLEILRKAAPRLPPGILLLPPVNLDTLAEAQVGHNVLVVTGGVSAEGSRLLILRLVG